MNFEGRIGKHKASANLQGKKLTITQQKKSVEKKLMFIACQRFNKNLKEFDVVWVCTDSYHIHSIPTIRMDDLKGSCEVPFFDIGPDPGPWKNWWDQSQKNNWKFRDWEFRLTPITSEEEDSDWEPCDDEHSEDDDFTDDDQ